MRRVGAIIKKIHFEPFEFISFGFDIIWDYELLVASVSSLHELTNLRVKT